VTAFAPPVKSLPFHQSYEPEDLATLEANIRSQRYAGMKAGAKVSEVLIEGVWRPALSGAELVVHNPATLEPVAAAPFCDAQDVVLAMGAARRALESWRACPSETRTALLVEIGRELSAWAPAIAELQARESGQAYRECLAGVLGGAKCFTQLSDQEPNPARDACLSRDPAAAGARPLVLRQDYPLLHWARTAVSLLAEGSTLVCVAPRSAPLAVLRAARCASGLPLGVLNMLVASQDAVTAALGDGLLREPGTSATTEGARNGADVVFVGNTVELELTLAGTASLRLFDSGQRAGQSARIYVEQQLSHELADELHEYLAFLECGDPSKPATDLGPLRSFAALQGVEDQVIRALKRGALLKVGGRRYQPWGLRGYFFQPTLMIEGRGEERAPDEEVRGPVVIISPVRNLAEALRQQQASRVAFFGSDLDAQLRSLTAAGIDFDVADFTAPLERIMQSFGSAPRGPVRIEPVTSEQCSWFPYHARAAPT
jgi:acyl-CoA reductase-like NAD-dependent aldehyde dehydrogenase